MENNALALCVLHNKTFDLGAFTLSNERVMLVANGSRMWSGIRQIKLPNQRSASEGTMKEYTTLQRSRSPRRGGSRPDKLKPTSVREDIPGLGGLPPEDAARDAAHVAICPMIAGEDLQPGDHVGFGMENRRDRVWKSRVNAVGVVDPFLTAPVPKGGGFWLLLYPGTVTSLRHAWTHPKFPKEEANRK